MRSDLKLHNLFIMTGFRVRKLFGMIWSKWTSSSSEGSSGTCSGPISRAVPVGLRKSQSKFASILVGCFEVDVWGLDEPLSFVPI